MTRGQYIAMCLIGGLAAAAWWNSYRLAASLQKSGIYHPPTEFTI